MAPAHRAWIFGEPRSARTRFPAPGHRRRPAPGFLGGLALLAGLALAAAPLSGCTSVTSENIEQWKTTEKGPTKLEAALGDSSVDPKLRAQAALALIDIDRSDEVEKALGATPPDVRSKVVDGLIPGLTDAASGNGKGALPEKALANRDALFSVRSFTDPVAQVRIDAFLRGLIAKDLRVGRVRNGRHSVEKILAVAPGPAAEMLAGLLGEKLELGAVTAVTDLLVKLGDDTARDQGASHLVDRARHEHSIPDPLWRAIGVLGGPASRKFLGEQIESTNHDAATAAARALQQRREPAMLGLAIKVAANPKADRTVRDEMFGVIESIGGLEARAALVDIIRTDHEEVVRYRAFESLLAVASADGINAGLDAFPASASYKKVDVEDLLVKLIEKVGAGARPELVKGLLSKSPLTRITSVMTLEHLGTSADAAALGRLSGDQASPKGFPPGDSVGKEAAVVAGLVRSRT